MGKKINGTAARKLVMGLIRANEWGLRINAKHCLPADNEHIKHLLKSGDIVRKRESSMGGRCVHTYVVPADGQFTLTAPVCDACGRAIRHYRAEHGANCPVKLLLSEPFPESSKHSYQQAMRGIKRLGKARLAAWHKQLALKTDGQKSLQTQ